MKTRLFPAIALTVAVLLTALSSCKNEIKQQSSHTDILKTIMIASSADSRYAEVGDSLYNEGAISETMRDYMHCLEDIYIIGDYDKADTALQKIIEQPNADKFDRLVQIAAISERILVQTNYGHIETTTILALNALKQYKIEEAEKDLIALNSYIRFYCTVGSGLVYRGDIEEGEQYYNNSYELNLKYSKSGKDKEQWMLHRIALIDDILTTLVNNMYYSTAMHWIERQEKTLNEYKMLSNYNEVAYDGFMNNMLATKAQTWQILGKDKEAAEAFDEYNKTEYAKTATGTISSAYYLIAAKRWKEAAKAMEMTDAALIPYGMEMTLDVIKDIYLKKYQTNMMAGRKDTANHVANQICNVLDSAITHYTRERSSELATIYNTQEKEQIIAEKEASLQQTRVISLLIAIVLLVVFFVVYTWIRRRAARRLAEVKAAQERIEGELQIARDIQMSMVPHEFPNLETLDMYASMTPAKEVGGDLYGYVLHDNILYFALGDVSGKGVPASLFMAQATRLFQTMAHQGMQPAEICTRMNEALSGEDNVNSMFVTLWVGMLNIESGHLKFCNAGHNPPVIGCGDSNAEFMEMEPNTPIGLWPGVEYVGEERETIKGRPIFIYTDGLNEAEDPEKNQFGDERLLDILRNTHYDSAKQVIEMLSKQVEEHRRGAEPNDDLTMMCLKIS